MGKVPSSLTEIPLLIGKCSWGLALVDKMKAQTCSIKLLRRGKANLKKNETEVTG